jgi:hypothetical protein
MEVISFSGMMEMVMIKKPGMGFIPQEYRRI